MWSEVRGVVVKPQRHRDKCIATLSTVLQVAVEYGHIDRNVAQGRRRRLKVPKPRRTYLDRAEHITALLDAAGELDHQEDRRTAPWRRALLGVLVFAGLRIDECLSLRWRDVDLAGGRLRVRGTKTAAADRTVELLPALRDELVSYAAGAQTGDQDALVFATSGTGGRYAGGAKHSPSNVRMRVLGPAVKTANEWLAKRGVQQLPDGLTPHSLRRTFASLLVALGRDPAVVMRQMGHTSPVMTLGVYAAAMDWADGERERLRALVEGAKWQSEDSTAVQAPAEPVERGAA
jgi:integrase